LSFTHTSGIQTVSYLRNFIGVKILLSPLAHLFLPQSGALYLIGLKAFSLIRLAQHSVYREGLRREEYPFMLLIIQLGYLCLWVGGVSPLHIPLSLAPPPPSYLASSPYSILTLLPSYFVSLFVRIVLCVLDHRNFAPSIPSPHPLHSPPSPRRFLPLSSSAPPPPPPIVLPTPPYFSMSPTSPPSPPPMVMLFSSFLNPFFPPRPLSTRQNRRFLGLVGHVCVLLKIDIAIGLCLCSLLMSVLHGEPG
jgi:hypothetical protein